MSVRIRIHQTITGQQLTKGRRNVPAQWRTICEVYVGRGTWHIDRVRWWADSQDVLAYLLEHIPAARIAHVWDGCMLYVGGDPDKDSRESKGLQATSEYKPDATAD